jgi:hypothetical protein
VTRQGESLPSDFGLDRGMVVASGERLRLLIALTLIDPKRKGQ